MSQNLFQANANGIISGAGLRVQCAIGKGGTCQPDQKREGDGCSPLGTWPMRRVFYRPDRLTRPQTGLACVALKPHDGWCDDAAHALYNRPVTRPFAASHERLWREDHVYDLIVELGFNDAPVVAGRGSAIFFHLARPDYSPTEGCVAVAQSDMLKILMQVTPGTQLKITN